jgi:hypothetical protein
LIDQPTAETGAEGTPSIEDTLSKTFDDIASRDSSDNRELDDDNDADPGTEESPTAKPETDTDEVTDTTDQDDAEGKGPADEQPLSPHERWSAERKAEFASLPRKAQEILLQREAETNAYLTQESQKIADLKRTYEPLERHIGPRREAWALSGFTPDTALEHLFALSDFATRDKPGFVRWFAQQHGVDLSEASTGADAPDPKITALEQRVQSFEQKEQQRQQQAVEQSRQTVQSAITQFAADTKSNPYFKDVETDVAAILPGIVQQNPGASHKELLKIAYDKAVWANEPIRAKLLAEQKKAEDLKAAEAAKKAKAAGTNVKTSGSLPDGRRKLTMDETMSEAYDRANARA